MVLKMSTYMDISASNVLWTNISGLSEESGTEVAKYLLNHTGKGLSYKSFKLPLPLAILAQPHKTVGNRLPDFDSVTKNRHTNKGLCPT